jgi:hypothetical protein
MLKELLLKDYKNDNIFKPKSKNILEPVSSMKKKRIFE